MKRIVLSICLLLTPFVPALLAQQSAEEIDPQELIVPQVSSKQGHSIIRKEYPTLESIIKLQDSLANNRVLELRTGSNRDLSQYAVGSIPIQESVSPSGARIYNIPITTAQGFNLTPGISLVYNSQSGNNVAGYGWGIGGLSSITVRNSNLYYDGTAKGGVYSSISSYYALDGIPLVTSEMGLDDFTLSSSRGNIQVKKNKNFLGQTLSFTALYPDGSTATFGTSGYFVQRRSYPLTQLTDKDGNSISFNYTYAGNNYYISSINYGNNSSIVFTYSTRGDEAPYGTASFGQSDSFPQKLLKAVTVLDGDAVVCEYGLSHQFLDGVSLLKEVHCRVADGELPPLGFEYGIDAEHGYSGDPAFVRIDSLLFFKYFVKSDNLSLQYHRGKLIPCHLNDGVVILPQKSTYARIDSTWVMGWKFLYGSKYSSNQEFLCNFTAYDPSGQTTILAEYGFQLIEAVDVDGDGTDELVKINFGSASRDVTTYKVTVYSFDRSYNISSRSFSVNINDGWHNLIYFNPAKSYYRFGNFKGDGKTMLLIMTKHHSKFALIDLNEGTKISETSLFTIDDEMENLVLAADFENDGKADLCQITDSGMEVYSLTDTSSTSFSLRTTYSGVTKDLLYRDTAGGQSGPVSKARIYTIDLNADGYLDIASAPDDHLEMPSLIYHPSRWNFARFNGQQFSVDTTFVKERKPEDPIIFLDVDKDGLTDILHIQDSMLYYCPNVNGRFSEYYNYAGVTLNASSDLVPGDLSLFGLNGDIIVNSGPEMKAYRFSLDHSSRRNLSQLTDSFGNLSINMYARTGEYGGAYMIDSNRSFSSSSGFLRLRAPISVLMSEYHYDANYHNYNYKNYIYWDAVYHSRGLGFCGFGKIETWDSTTGDWTTSVLNPESFGAVTSVTISKSFNGQPFNTVTNTYDNNTTTYGKLNPRLTHSVAVDSLTGISTTTSYTYGAYDLPTYIQTSSRIGNGNAKTVLLSRSYSNSVSASKYLLGLITNETKVTDADESQMFHWQEMQVNNYDDLGHRVLTRQYVGQIFAGSLVSTTSLTYDSHGNLTSEKTAPYGATTFTGDTLVYDANGRYLVSKTDALGRTTTYSGYNKFGKPTVVTDYHNHVTTYTYDSWGNLTQVSRPDGGVEQTTRAWGGDGLYTVTQTATGSPETIAHYDALGREIKSGVKRFDGQWQYTNREYDSRGRLSRVSLPYRGSSPSYWNTYHYDAYDRPDSLCEASGRRTRWSYSGTSTTTVKDGISITRTTDALGRVVSVTDAGGTITYALRDDGQPSTITAPGNVVTTFTYDAYGRRTQMVDPSLGTETDSYVWNADGSSVFTHTNRNGTVVTSKDRYGRTTQVQRQGEFNTTYTYDTYGRLSSVQSTNDTGKRYAYDDYDRVNSVKDTVPDGKWLQKVYTYGPGSVLSSIAYTCQSGYITTETYTYANGHNTGITIPNNVTVWSLTSENDLGMPTAITTGNITRQYGYTDYGLPTYRKMNGGALQDFSYQFDPLTCNLLSRSDGRTGATESFGYDQLNRLVEMTEGNTTREIVYTDNGNITSIDGVGTLVYGGGAGVSPYEVTGLIPEPGQQGYRQRTVTYNSFDRPASVSEDDFIADFTYDGSGNKVLTHVHEIGTGTHLKRYYVSDRYEYELEPITPTERLYLGGDAYSAPMVLQRTGANGTWTLYDIGRDYLGSITEIVNDSNTSSAYHYRYDPWGKLVNYSRVQPYFLGRGYTGHEHLPWFGLINANARLYDPLLGRFLSPDPYVQDPDFTQNYNRFSYCLNNPLKYTDESGEFVITTTVAILITGAAIGAVVGMYQGYKIGESKGADGWAMAGYMLCGGLIGGVAGLASGIVGLAVAPVVASAGLGGFIGGAAIGGLTGATAGWINGLGFGLLSTGSISSALKSAGLGLLSGTLSGAVVGGVIGGVGSTIKGNDFWTGGHKIQAQANRHNPLPSPKNKIEICTIESPRAIDNIPDEYTIRWETENNGIFRMDDLSSSLSIKRPDIAGYSNSLTSGDAYHDFPYLFDDYIVKYGASYSRMSDGSSFYTMTGSINGQNGVYTIGINDSGIVYHRCFFPKK